MLTVRTALLAARTETRTLQTKVLGQATRMLTSSAALFARATEMLSLRKGTPGVAGSGDARPRGIAPPLSSLSRDPLRILSDPLRVRVGARFHATLAPPTKGGPREDHERGDRPNWVGTGERNEPLADERMALMNLSTTLDQLRKSLSSPTITRAYAGARPRHRVFAPYETAAALLAAIDRGSPLPIEARDAIIAAIVEELQHGADGLWQTLLLVAFTPALVDLRRKIHGRPTREDPGDLDKSVLLAFLEVARSLRTRSYVARSLVLATRSRVFDERRREQRAPDTEVFDEETHAHDPYEVEAQQRAEASEVVRIVEAEGGEELCDLLLASCPDDERAVFAYVQEAYAHCTDRDRARASKRLRRARQKAFARLREREEEKQRRPSRAA
jgi:hypothetical protein